MRACVCRSSREASNASQEKPEKVRQLFQTRNVFLTVSKSDESLTIAQLEATRPHAAIHPAIGFCCCCCRCHCQSTANAAAASSHGHAGSPLIVSSAFESIKKVSFGVFIPLRLNLSRGLVHRSGRGREKAERTWKLWRRTWGK